MDCSKFSFQTILPNASQGLYWLLGILPNWLFPWMTFSFYIAKSQLWLEINFGTIEYMTTSTVPTLGILFFEYLCPTLNALTRISVCPARSALLIVVSIIQSRPHIDGVEH